MNFVLNETQSNDCLLFNSDQGSDVLIVSQSVKFNAHQNILSRESDYFRTLFSSQMTAGVQYEEGKRVILLPGDHTIVDIILRYLYGCRVEINLLQFPKVGELALFLHIEPLIRYTQIYKLPFILSPYNGEDCEMYSQKQNSDVNIIINNSISIPAHSRILAKNSEYFRSPGTFNLQGNPTIIQLILYYLYGCRLRVNLFELYALYHTALFLGVSPLIKYVNRLNIGRIPELYNIARSPGLSRLGEIKFADSPMMYAIGQLMNNTALLNIIIDRNSRYLNTPGVPISENINMGEKSLDVEAYPLAEISVSTLAKTDYLRNLLQIESASLLARILFRDDLNVVSEEEVIKFLEEWRKIHKRDFDLNNKILEYVRFATIPKYILKILSSSLSDLPAYQVLFNEALEYTPDHRIYLPNRRDTPRIKLVETIFYYDKDIFYDFYHGNSYAYGSFSGIISDILGDKVTFKHGRDRIISIFQPETVPYSLLHQGRIGLGSLVKINNPILLNSGWISIDEMTITYAHTPEVLWK